MAKLANIKIWKLPELPHLDLMRATYVEQRFDRHTHDGFAVGVIENGALGFFYRGENVIAGRGEINLANPDEAHTGHAAVPEGWSYRMFYIQPDILNQAACQIAGRRVQTPYFQAGVLQDKWLADMIRRVHISLENEENPTLEKESLVLMMISHLIRRHSDAPPIPLVPGNERSSVQRARQFIDANCCEDISIENLAAIAHLSPYHFIRTFHKEMGLPPHRYLKQARAKNARELISSGRSITEAALESGFVDQSHLSRNFKSIFGFTPGQYSSFVQDGRSTMI